MMFMSDKMFKKTRRFFLMSAALVGLLALSFASFGGETDFFSVSPQSAYAQCTAGSGSFTNASGVTVFHRFTTEATVEGVTVTVTETAGDAIRVGILESVANAWIQDDGGSGSVTRTFDAADVAAHPNFSIAAGLTAGQTVTVSYTICTPSTGGAAGGTAAGADSPTIAVADPDGDFDGDGVINRDDNCPGIPNPDQADGYGGLAGNVCDTDFFDNEAGIKAYQNKDGGFNVFGCGPGGCELASRIPPSAFSGTGTNRYEGGQLGWYTEVIYAGESDGRRSYQVNTYDESGTLQDDQLQIYATDSFITWLFRGRDSRTGRGIAVDPNAIAFDPSSFNAGPLAPGGNGVTLANLILRVEPRQNAPELADQIPWGTLVSILREDESGAWFEISGAGLMGWVPRGWLGPADTTPIRTENNEPFTANPVVRPGQQGQAISPLNMRTEPNRNSPDNGFQVPTGMVVNVLEEDPTGYWFLVEAGGQRGWVANEWIGELGTVGAAPRPTTATSVSVGDQAVTVARLNARSGPGEGNDLLYEIPSGTDVTVLGIQDGWVQIEFSGRTAWIIGGYLGRYDPTPGLTRLDSGNAAPEAQSSQPSTTTPVEQPATSQEPATTQADPPAAETTQADTPTTTEPTSFTANPDVRPGDTGVTVGTLNLRTEPSLTASTHQRADETAIQVPWGTRLFVIEESADGYWFLVEYEGVRGWISNEWLLQPGTYSERGGATVPSGQ